MRKKREDDNTTDDCAKIMGKEFVRNRKCDPDPTALSVSDIHVEYGQRYGHGYEEQWIVTAGPTYIITEAGDYNRG